MRALLALIHDEDGGMTAETALMLVLVSIAGFAAYQALGVTVAGFADQASGPFGEGP